MSQRRIKNKGVVAVEAAIVLPILILVMIAGLEYGWLLLKQQEITNIARHYVRYATRPEVTEFGTLRGDMIAELNKLALIGFTIDQDETIIAWVNENDTGVGSPLYAQVSIISDKEAEGFLLPLPEKLRAHATMSKEGQSASAD